MSDVSRTKDAMNQDPSALRRRARRRLVGAVAIALVTILVVPMLFDPDPKPLGSDVDIRIPSQESPFEPGQPPQAENGATQSAASEPIQAEPTPTSPAPKVTASATANQETAKDDKKPAAKPAAKPELKPQPKPEPKPVVKAAPAAEKPAPKPTLKPEPAFASRGYYLQLGVFSNAANAGNLKAKAESAGFKVETTDSNGQYRVRVGPIVDREKALDTLSKLRGKGFSAVMIGP